jgi:hypothetical protein
MYTIFYLYDPRLQNEETMENEVGIIITTFVIAGGLNVYAHFLYSEIENQNAN